MKKITALLLFSMLMYMFSCNQDDDINRLTDRVDELEEQLDSTNILNYRDSLDFILSMNQLDYQRYADSLRRADSLAISAGGNLPFTYSLLVYDGSTTSIFSDNGARSTDATAFDGEVTVSVAQFGQVRSVTTTDGLASFNDIGRGLVKVTVSAADYTTLQFSFETLIDPSTGLYNDPNYQTQDFWQFIKTGAIGHDVALFATAGQFAATLTGRAFTETDLTNNTQEVVPEGTTITAAIDVEDGTFQDEFILNRNKAFFTDNILSFGYDPIFTAATDANGDYTFTLAGAANENGLPYHFEYSDFLADQTAFVETTGEVTTEVEQTIYGPEAAYTIVPAVANAATVSFAAGGGATAILDFEGDGSVIDIDLASSGANFQGDPRVFISAPPAGGTLATATATVANGRVNSITITDNGAGYVLAPTVTVTEGTGAAATVNGLFADGTNGGVADVQVVTTGSGYGANPPNVLFSNVGLTGVFVTDSTNIANFAAANPDLPTATSSLGVNGTLSSISVGNTGADLTDQAPNVIVTTGFGAAIVIGGVDGVTGAIQSVTINNPGLYYSEIINVDIAGGADADITFATNAQGQITGATINNGGTGYTTGTAININTNVTQATATPVMEGLSIEDMTITDDGTQFADGMFYTNVPLIEISEPDFKGTGSRRATANAVLSPADGRVVGIDITDAGSGYTGLPTVTFVSGSAAVATATIAAVTITEVDVVLPGSGYLAPPAVAIYDAGGTGSGAAATAVISLNGTVTSIILDNAGTNYSNPQVVIVDPGTSFDPTDGSLIVNIATAEVEITDGSITAINMTSLGDNYPAGTNMLLSAGRGTGFDASVNVTAGQISSITINDGGADYIGGNVPGVTLPFSGIEGVNGYHAKTSITRVIDIDYGTGARRNANVFVPIP